MCVVKSFEAHSIFFSTVFCPSGSVQSLALLAALLKLQKIQMNLKMLLQIRKVLMLMTRSCE